MSKYDWSDVPAIVNVITTNKYGEKEFWTMYNGALPKRGESLWFDEYRGRLANKSSISEFKGDWRDSLEERPK